MCKYNLHIYRQRISASLYIVYMIIWYYLIISDIIWLCSLPLMAPACAACSSCCIWSSSACPRSITASWADFRASQRSFICSVSCAGSLLSGEVMDVKTTMYNIDICACRAYSHMFIYICVRVCVCTLYIIHVCVRVCLLIFTFILLLIGPSRRFS